MSLFFSYAPIISDTRWTAFKAIYSLKVMSMQYDDDGVGYSIYAVDGQIVHRTYIWQGTMPSTDPSYSQAQNDTDKADFETNYKSYCNRPVVDSELDPRLIHRFGNLTSASTSEVLMAARPYTEPASQAQRSVVSTSASDTGDVRITYLDSNYVLRTEDKTLTGTTPVNTVATDIRFIQKFQIIRGAAAVGAIKLMSATAGGGTEICGISAGTEDAFLCHHYVAAGMRAWILGWGATVDGNANFKLKGQQWFGANLVDQNIDLQNLFIGATGQPQRSDFYRLFQKALPVGEKCYIRVTVVPGQAGSTVERAVLDLWEDKA